MVGVGRKVCVVQGMLDQVGPQPVTEVLVGRRTNTRQRDERVEGRLSSPTRVKPISFPGASSPSLVRSEHMGMFLRASPVC